MKKSLLSLLLISLLSSCTFDFSFGSSKSESLTSLDSISPSLPEDISPNSVSASEIVSTSENVSISSITSNSVNDGKEELLKNIEFNNLDNWELYSDNNTQASILSQGNKQITLKINNNSASQNWSIQLLQKNISLLKNQTCEISFDLMSSVTRSVQFLLQSCDYSYMAFERSFQLKANEKMSFSTNVVLDQSTTYLYGFMMGNVNGTIKEDHTITISNVSLLSSSDLVVPEPSEGKNGTFDSAPQTINNRRLVWQDEFNGTEIDQTKWSYEIGDSGWGNNEYQYYTNRKENSYCSNGSLKIVARKENYGSRHYTSARLRTKGKFEFTYGYVETRIALPSMLGIWPAFWLLGANIDENPWPYCGEIDVLEAINDESKVYSTLHWNNGTNYSPADYGNGGVNINDRTSYHTYGFEWTSTGIQTYLDNTPIFYMDISGNEGKEAFRKDFYFLFNVAVGGNWPGFNIGSNFPQAMSVDYIRVYQ